MSAETFGRRELMLNLIYPAVLGTVLYSFLAASVTPAVPEVASFLGRRTVTQAAVPFQPLKAAILFITFLFYLSDYFYVMYTKEYLRRFFVYSIAILVGLAFTVAAVDVSTTSAPELSVVFAFYALFMFLYFVWDANEWLRDRDITKPLLVLQTNDENERWFYRVVLAWELFSFVGLVVCTRLAAKAMSGTAVVAVLSVITVSFLVVAAWKRQIHTKWAVRCREAIP